MSPNPLTQTLDLIRKVKAGDRDALDRLIARYYERLRRSVRPRLGRRLRQFVDSGDVLQLTFQKACQLFGNFELRHEGSFLHWLAEIAAGQINDLGDFYQRKKRDPGKPVVEMDASNGEVSGSLAAAIPSRDSGPAGRSIRHENEQAVDECLHELADQYRQVIILRDYDGLEWREIAAIMNKNSDSAPRELHTKAKLELGKLLMRRGYGPKENG